MSEEKKSWSKNEVFALISEWELLPELWDTKSKLYRNKTKKQSALQGLADRFNTSVNEVSRKLHNLRTQFHSEIRKVKTKKSTDMADDDYHSSWDFFDTMKFISSDHLDSSNTDSMIMSESLLELDYSQETLAEKTIEPEQKKLKIAKIKEPDYDLVLKQAGYLIRKPSDEFQIFGDYVASELRNLRSEDNQRKLKLDIQRAILRATEADWSCGCSSQLTDALDHNASR